MNFELVHTDPHSAARAGVITTGHGTIETPIFMPVGTVGSVKGVFHRDLQQEVGAQIILGNTYHLYLRPGTEILERAGGLHRFCGWERRFSGLFAGRVPQNHRGRVPFQFAHRRVETPVYAGERDGRAAEYRGRYHDGVR